MVLRAGLALTALVLTGLILFAVRAGDFGAAGDWLTGEPWGLVTLFDLYFGFVLAAIVIALAERRIVSAAFWILPIFVLGNVWTALWFVVRGLHLLKAAMRERHPA